MYKKIVIASDSFKGSVSSRQVADSSELAIKALMPDCEVIRTSIADGGEGTMESLCESLHAETVSITASDPLGRPVEVKYAVKGSTAIIEMSQASGLPLLKKNERNPMKTSTFGTGEMILDALNRGITTFLVGIGGSATNDGGTGMLSALGARFLDKDGNALEGTGENLIRIQEIDLGGLDSRLKEADITVACDVDTPFCGKDGAAYVFAPQKGAAKDQVELLDKGLEHFAEVILNTTGNDIQSIPGSGAAGGLGGAFKGILSASLTKGIDMVLDVTGFNKSIEDADLIITGEGKIDFQTAKGKTASGVLQRAKAKGIPVVALAGIVQDCKEVQDLGFEAILEISKDLPTEIAMKPEVAMANIQKAVSSFLKDRIQKTK